MRKRTFFERTFLVCLLSLAFQLSCMSAAHAADAPIAEVLTVVPGASVSRDGQTLPLERFSPLLLSDTVTTDATGRVRILFADDSTVDLGPNSSLDLRDFADSGASSVFKVHLLQGVARVITGKIVEQNPQGFAVSTPEGTIGIRGTIISLRAGNGATTVYVENTTRAVYVNNINVPAGQKITLPADPVRPEPILPQDRRNLGRDLAFRGGAGVAAAAPEPDSGRPEEPLRAGTRTPTPEHDLIPPDTLLAEGGVLEGLSPLGPNPPAPAYPINVTGFTGTSSYYFGDLGFGFEVDPGSGAISDAWVSGTAANSMGTSDGATLVDLYGGNGSWDSGSGAFTLSDFSGSYTMAPGSSYAFGVPGIPVTPGAGTSLTGNLAALQAGTPIAGGNFQVVSPVPLEAGPLAGSVASRTASVSGVTADSSQYFGSLPFGFTLDMDSGAVADAWVSGTAANYLGTPDGETVVNLTGGSGSWSSGSGAFSLSNFSGSYTMAPGSSYVFGTPGVPVSPGTAASLTGNLANLLDGTSIAGGNFQVVSPLPLEAGSLAGLVISRTAAVSGVTANSSQYFGSLPFGFTLDMDSGAVADAWVSGTAANYLGTPDGETVVNLTGGSGSWISGTGNFVLSSFSGTYTMAPGSSYVFGTPGSPVTPGTATSLTGNLANLLAGTSITGGNLQMVSPLPLETASLLPASWIASRTAEVGGFTDVSSYYFGSLPFGFSLDLDSGAASDGWITGTAVNNMGYPDGATAVNLTGGSGTWDPIFGNFVLGLFSGTYTMAAGSSSLMGAAGVPLSPEVKLTGNLANLAAGTSITTGSLYLGAPFAEASPPATGSIQPRVATVNGNFNVGVNYLSGIHFGFDVELGPTGMVPISNAWVSGTARTNMDPLLADPNYAVEVDLYSGSGTWNDTGYYVNIHFSGGASNGSYTLPVGYAGSANMGAGGGTYAPGSNTGFVGSLLLTDLNEGTWLSAGGSFMLYEPGNTDSLPSLLAIGLVQPYVATVQGTTSGTGYFGALDFSFDVDLGTSGISNGEVWGTSATGIVVDFSRGSGAWDSGSTEFSIDFYDPYYGFYAEYTPSSASAFGTAGVTYRVGSGTQLSGKLADLNPGTSVTDGVLTVVSIYQVSELVNLGGSVQSSVALVTGTTSGASRYFGNLPFSFEVALGSGSIANGRIVGTASNTMGTPDGATSVNLTGGSGAWNIGSGDFSVAGFSGTYILAPGATTALGTPGVSILPQGTSLTGNLADLNTGTAITGGALNVRGLTTVELAPLSGAVYNPTALVTGSTSGASRYFGNLPFSFEVALGSGAIANGSVVGTASNSMGTPDGATSVSLTGGSGAWDIGSGDFSVAGFSGSYTLAPGAATALGAPGVAISPLGTSLTGNLANLASTTAITGGALNVQGLAATELAPLAGGVQYTIATVTGSSSGASLYLGQLPFSFEVSLGSGAIANGLISGIASNSLGTSDGATLVNLTGGSGAWNSGSGDFSVAGFSGTYTLAPGAATPMGAPGVAVTPQAGTSLMGNLANLNTGAAITGGALNVQGLAASDLAPLTGSVK
ncbi:MAG: FecR family protein [Deltaproteobacteria bacterium]|jgi:hypothetical protein|nr:FecR family protein [Deltaproteobacteria bacterium]